MSDLQNQENNQLVLICGLPTSGKTTSLRNIQDQESWIYMCSEAGKRPTFKNKFKVINIADPLEVLRYFDYGIANPDKVKGIIIDSISYLMDMFDLKYIRNATDTRTAWGDYSAYFKQILQDRVIRFPNPVIITGHVQEVYDEKSMTFNYSVPVKGSLAKLGVESFFSTIVMCKKVPIKTLEDKILGGASATPENISEITDGLLHLTPKEIDLGFKYCYQVQITKETLGERIRAPLDLWTDTQIFVDPDAQLLLDKLNNFYNS